ncbi:MAG: DUF6788 family protein [Candidatus Humimicrobiaceae bacterium]
MDTYKMKINTAWLTRKRDGLIKKLSDVGPFVDGSLVKVKRRCGNKNCKCYLLGQKHECYYLQHKIKGVTKGVYIPVDMVDEVKEWNVQYKRLKKIIADISKTNKEIIKRYTEEKKLKKGRQ